MIKNYQQKAHQFISRNFLALAVILAITISLPLLNTALTQEQNLVSKAQTALVINQSGSECEGYYPYNYLKWKPASLVKVYQLRRSDGALYYPTATVYKDRGVRSGSKYSYVVVGMDANYTVVTPSSSSVTITTKDCASKLSPTKPASTNQPPTVIQVTETSTASGTVTIPTGGPDEPASQQVSIIDQDDPTKEGIFGRYLKDTNLLWTVGGMLLVLLLSGLGLKWVFNQHVGQVNWDWSKPTKQ